MEGIVRIIRRQSQSSGSISMQVHRYNRLLVIVAAYQGVFYFSQQTHAVLAEVVCGDEV
jgi:hypothetical protein